jgi:hypothetical protein
MVMTSYRVVAEPSGLKMRDVEDGLVSVVVPAAGQAGG